MTVLIDTSSWIHALRKSGEDSIRRRVQTLLLNGDAAWCDLIRLELCRGASTQAERAYLNNLHRDITTLPLTASVWERACGIGQVCRKAGKPVPTVDLIIAACAREHEVALEHNNRHFRFIDKALGK